MDIIRTGRRHFYYCCCRRLITAADTYTARSGQSRDTGVVWCCVVTVVGHHVLFCLSAAHQLLLATERRPINSHRNTVYATARATFVSSEFCCRYLSNGAS